MREPEFDHLCEAVASYRDGLGPEYNFILNELVRRAQFVDGDFYRSLPYCTQEHLNRILAAYQDLLNMLYHIDPITAIHILNTYPPQNFDPR